MVYLAHEAIKGGEKVVNVDKLIGRIAEKRMTQKEVANRLGMTEATMTRRLKTGKFWSDELEQLADILEIDSPGDFFWPEW